MLLLYARFYTKRAAIERNNGQESSEAKFEIHTTISHQPEVKRVSSKRKSSPNIGDVELSNLTALRVLSLLFPRSFYRVLVDEVTSGAAAAALHCETPYPSLPQS